MYRMLNWKETINVSLDQRNINGIVDIRVSFSCRHKLKLIGEMAGHIVV